MRQTGIDVKNQIEREMLNSNPLLQQVLRCRHLSIWRLLKKVDIFC